MSHWRYKGQPLPQHQKHHHRDLPATAVRRADQLVDCRGNTDHKFLSQNSKPPERVDLPVDQYNRICDDPLSPQSSPE